MEIWEEGTRSWGKKQRRGFWLKYLGAVVGTIAAVQAVNNGFEWYAQKVAGLQTARMAEKQHKEMQEQTNQKVDKLAERIEAAVDKLGTRVDRLAGRRKR